MKAVIVDIRKKRAAALDESGRVVCIHNAGYKIGQNVELHDVKPIRSSNMLIRHIGYGMIAAVMIAVVGTGTAYAVPYGTVSLEGEPSVEYTINCFDYVLDVQAANEDGKSLLSGTDLRQLRHHRIDQAVTVTMEKIEQDNYLGDTEASILISADTRNEGHTKRLYRELVSVVERADISVVREEGINNGIFDAEEGASDEIPAVMEEGSNNDISDALEEDTSDEIPAVLERDRNNNNLPNTEEPSESESPFKEVIQNGSSE